MQAPPAPYRPDPQFLALADTFADPVSPARFPRHILRWRNQRWADRVGLGGLSDAQWEAAFARFEPLDANLPRPLAMRYLGHQFRVYNRDIGDGRGFLFAQLRDERGRLLDLATKGSGQTPYSRRGDGRLTLKGGVREVLAAAMLEAQGVSTSKAFSLFETGEALERGDEPSPTRSSVLVRLSHSHMRFGTFQRAAFFERADEVRTLVDHCIAAYYPGLASVPDSAQPAAFLAAVVDQSAKLAGEWMAAGFVHGVLNTDNMVVTGESFDYGPWRFLPAAEPGFTAAYFDHAGLYAFARQPEAVGWNLAQLAGCLALGSDDAPLIAALQGCAAAYHRGFRDAAFARLGMKTADLDGDAALLSALFGWMREAHAPWDQVFHDWFCGAASADRALAGPLASAYRASSFSPVRTALEARTPVRADRLRHPYFSEPTPASLKISEVEALWAPIAEADDWSLFTAKLQHIDALRTALDLPPRAPHPAANAATG